MKTHQEIERRSLLLHRLISHKLLRNPELMERPRATISRWRKKDPEASALCEWEDLLSRLDIQGVAKLLRSRDQNAIRLRQSSPFTGILTEGEREKVLRKYAISSA